MPAASSVTVVDCSNLLLDENPGGDEWCEVSLDLLHRCLTLESEEAEVRVFETSSSKT